LVEGTLKGTYFPPDFETSQPVGSWAVDRRGDIFESFIYPTTVDAKIVPKVQNKLYSKDAQDTGPVDVAKLRDTGHPEYEYAFYPVAPL
jgi:hypothetical protein